MLVETADIAHPAVLETLDGLVNASDAFHTTPGEQPFV